MHLYYPPAYVPTNHLEWLDSAEVTEVAYLTRFEPYYIARLPLPRFNESFINRGGNYAQQVRYPLTIASRLLYVHFLLVSHLSYACNARNTNFTTRDGVRVVSKRTTMLI